MRKTVSIIELTYSMILAYILVLCVTVNGLVHAYDVDTDLARSLVCDYSIIIEIKSSDGRYFSEYPEDCAAINLNPRALNQQAISGIYEIWPREGMFRALTVPDRISELI
jgi:hypothetical protein